MQTATEHFMELAPFIKTDCIIIPQGNIVKIVCPEKQSEKTVEETQKCAIMALIQLPKEGFFHEF